MTHHDTLQRILNKKGLEYSDTPIVMGILNCTPDSFYEGSRKQTEYEIATRADEIIEQGGIIIDVGAFSTRPGAMEVSEDEELKRMSGALSIIRKTLPGVMLSIDTYRPSVARMAVEEYGADIINDVSEGGITGIVDTPLIENKTDDDAPAIFKEVARLQVPYILMSVQHDMKSLLHNFKKEVAMLKALGVNDVILDPGYGFGKDIIIGNYSLLNSQMEIKQAFPELPILAGMSRKRMIWQLLNTTPTTDAARYGTMLTNLVALQNGADILRVHDVKEACDTITIYNTLKKNFKS